MFDFAHAGKRGSMDEFTAQWGAFSVHFVCENCVIPLIITIPTAGIQQRFCGIAYINKSLDWLVLNKIRMTLYSGGSNSTISSRQSVVCLFYHGILMKLYIYGKFIFSQTLQNSPAEKKRQRHASRRAKVDSSLAGSCSKVFCSRLWMAFNTNDPSILATLRTTVRNSWRSFSNSSCR